MSTDTHGATHNHSPRMVELATKWLLEYFSDGVARKPGDFEDDFCGQWSISLGPWRDTPFYPALATLVAEGKIVFGRVHCEDPVRDLDVMYAVPGKLPPDCVEGEL